MEDKFTSVDFKKMKLQRMQALDISKKSSIDDRIKDFMEFINKHEQYFTTSSCSGRCLVFCKTENSKKKNCQWIFVSHDEITAAQLKEALDPLKGDLTIKFEPFILHVQCRSLEDAKILLQSGTEAGFRNSGLTIGNKGKIITAIRSPLSLEIPVTRNQELLVKEKFVDYIAEEINQKFQENWERTLKFSNLLLKHLEGQCLIENLKCEDK